MGFIRDRRERKALERAKEAPVTSSAATNTTAAVDDSDDDAVNGEELQIIVGKLQEALAHNDITALDALTLSTATAYSKLLKKAVNRPAPYGTSVVTHGMNAEKASLCLPLHKAIWKSQFAFVRRFVEMGANLDTPMSAQYPTYLLHELSKLTRTGNRAISSPILLQMFRSPEQIAAEEAEFAALMETVIHYGGDVNLKDCTGSSPLHLAILPGGCIPSRIRLLLDNGADVEDKKVLKLLLRDVLPFVEDNTGRRIIPSSSLIDPIGFAMIRGEIGALSHDVLNEILAENDDDVGKEGKRLKCVVQ